MSIATIATIVCSGCADGSISDASSGNETPAETATPEPSPEPTPGIVDADGDGLDDAAELKAAYDYQPFIALDVGDACPLGGLLVRVRPHPENPAFLFIHYVHVYETDCGFLGHIGDDESFGVTADPSKVAGEGILSIKAISHQNTPCERVTECGRLPGMSACTTQTIGGVTTPVLFASKDKHANYADKNVCDTQSCFDSCSLPPSAAPRMIVNAGEPERHLTEDLTTNGFITADNGWTEPTLMSFDPWAPGNFGEAGDISLDLVDPAFLTAVPLP